LTPNPDYIEKFVKFLSDTNWHKFLIDSINKYIIGCHSLTEIDKLFMSITKIIEMFLVDAVTKKQGSPVPSKFSYGIKLLNYAIQCRLIKSKDEPIYSLLYWIFKEPRNTSHHNFLIYPYNTLVMFMTEFNEAMERIENLVQSSYRANFNTRYNQTDKKIEIENVQVWIPDGTPLPDNQKVEAAIKFSDQRTKTTPLEYNGTYWKGNYDTRGLVCGLGSVYIQGVNRTENFVVTSGSVVVISFPIGQNCPNCRRTITSNTYFCPYCGAQLTIY